MTPGNVNRGALWFCKVYAGEGGEVSEPNRLLSSPSLIWKAGQSVSSSVLELEPSSRLAEAADCSTEEGGRECVFDLHVGPLGCQND